MRVALILLVLVMLACPTDAAKVEEKHPAEVVQVTAEGEAVASEPDARDLAVADALRNAVVTAVGAYVDSTTVGENYKVVQNEILVKADGFATLDRVEATSTQSGILHVRIKASVRALPLAEKLKELGLTHEWKVGVRIKCKPEFLTDTAAETAIIDKLVKSGYRVIDEYRRQLLVEDELYARAAQGDLAALAAIKKEYDVDILITGDALAEDVDRTEEGGVTFYRDKARMDARALYTDTGEVITLTSATAEAVDQTRSLSAQACLEKAGASVGATLAQDILVAPAAMNPFVTVKITGLKKIASANEFERAMKYLPGVSRVRRQRYSGGVLELNLYVKSEYREMLPVKMEASNTGRKLGIHIEAWSKTCIQGRASKG
jgi:hypothetical protein